MRRVFSITASLVLAGALLAAGDSRLPNVADSLKMAIIGDNGTGSREQMDVAAQMVTLREQFPYDLVLMVGDNFYGAQRAADLERKFARPYGPLLAAGVTFQAALGNH